jgi:hypothetical protein
VAACSFAVKGNNMSAYQGWTERPEVIEERKQRILGQAAPQADKAKKGAHQLMAELKRWAIKILLIGMLIDVLIGFELARHFS